VTENCTESKCFRAKLSGWRTFGRIVPPGILSGVTSRKCPDLRAELKSLCVAVMIHGCNTETNIDRQLFDRLYC